jgi:peptidoglycan/LPS O-acetylase OafA/YrhL
MAEIFWGTRRYPAPRSILEGHAVPATGFRPDIQGLRAVAVLAVLLSHVWPKAIPGGFVGVDVFFVISGYLITGLLFRELQRTGRIALSAFYIRRMKRLLPAATLVLVVVAILTICLLPPSRWEETIIEVLASAFYLENWRLAWLATDYFGADNAVSPVRHFWSLSIEEQFYIFWPLVMIAAGAVARRFTDLRTAVMVPLLLLVAVSFGASVVLTETRPEAAYYLTYTRIWQLGLGAALALVVLPDFSLRVREAMRTAGLAAIVLAVFAFSGGMAFPGYAALLPTLGCALVLAAGTKSEAWSVSRVLMARPAQYLGDISYSVYLWHWPIIVFASYYAPGGLSLWLGLALIAATLVVAHLSKHALEDRVRYSNISMGKALAFAAGLTVCCILGAAATYHYFAIQLIKIYADSPNYPGARAFLAGAHVPPVDAPIPPPILLRKDKAETYKQNCHVGSDDATLTPCRYGPESGRKVVLIGDSHAANWAPALIAQVDKMGWRLETQTKSSCPLILAPVGKSGVAAVACTKWGENLLQYLQSSPPDIVILAQARFYQVEGVEGEAPRTDIASAMADVWRKLLALGIKVVAMRDIPYLPFDPGACIARDPACYAEQSQALKDDDPVLMAHRLVPEVPVIDMTDAVCRNGQCPMVVGNIIAWRDEGHLTATFSRTTAEVLAARVAEAAGGGHQVAGTQ